MRLRVELIVAWLTQFLFPATTDVGHGADGKKTPEKKRRAQQTTELKVSTAKLTNGKTIYHFEFSADDRCSPLHPRLCNHYLQGNPWTYGDFLNRTHWVPRQPSTKLVYRRLSQGCVPGLYGVLLKFPLMDPNATYNIYWGAGPLMIPFHLGDYVVPDSTTPAGEPLSEYPTYQVPTTHLACSPSIDLIVTEMDPNPREVVMSHLPKFNIGPLRQCTKEMAIQQCCWMECGYFILDFTQPTGPICGFALENKDLPQLPEWERAESFENPADAPVRDYQLWRVQRRRVAEIEQRIAAEALTPSSMLSFGGITEDVVEVIDIEKDFAKQRLHGGLSKTYVPCPFCASRGIYEPSDKTMSVNVVWDAHIIEPLLHFSGLPTFDHWVYEGNQASGTIYNDLPVLTPEEVGNLTNKDEVLARPIRFNDPQRVGLRLYVQAENYFTESKFSEDERDWPVWPFFDVALTFEKNFNCYPGRSVTVDDRIPWDESEMNSAYSRRFPSRCLSLLGLSIGFLLELTSIFMIGL